MKKKVQEEIALIEEMGQENEVKAAKVVIEKGKEDKKRDNEVEAKNLENLENKSRFDFKTYQHELAELIAQIIRFRGGFDKGWLWDSWSNSDGVGLTLLDVVTKKRYVRAFRPVNIPEYDLNACHQLVISAEETVDRIDKGKINKKGEIYLP